MKNMSEVKYSKTHEWIKISDSNTAEVGITDYAQSLLGDLVYINFPELGAEFAAGSAFADVESVKASSEIYMPVSGKVVEINEELINAPEKINESAQDAWIVKIKNISSVEDLMDEDEYKKYVESLDQ